MSKNKNNKQMLGIQVKKEENISEWYTQVIQKADLIEYTDVSGCMIFKPNSYQIWEKIQKFFDEKIKKSGVKNSYFPLFIPEKLLCKEAEHVEGFAPEVAWVTHSGNTKLKERLAVRPTSETIMYDAYSKWIRSYRDLPLRLNQWCNVVRWEFSHPTPFLRNREFLWQEGHTVYATKEEADNEVLEILTFYKQVYEDLLAIPVTRGRKSIGEKFAGADYTTTIEAIGVDGRSIQAATSHHLGQNFAKAFDIEFEDENKQKKLPYQNCWGISTRSIGAMIMIHSDDNGLVLPPRVAENKLVIIPLLFKGKEEVVLEKAKLLYSQLKQFNPILDDKTHESAGFKFNKYEIQGMPLRVEIGPRDIENNQIIIARRDKAEKITVSLDDDLSLIISNLLEDMHKNLFDKAKVMMKEKTVDVFNFEDFKKAIDDKKRCFVPWAESKESEKEIKEKTGAKSSCLPHKYMNKNLKNVKCFYSNKPATCWAYFAKSW